MDEKENNTADVVFNVFDEETLDLFLKKVDFSKQGGLVPAVVQDYFSKDILMLAFMNEEALRKSIESGFAHYFSRSRHKLWKKGETSGNIQEIRGIFFDCDSDSILLKVIQKGPACHTGHKTCFYSKINNGLIKTRSLENKGKEENKDDTLKNLYSFKLIFDLIKSRKGSDPDKSYVAMLLKSGVEKIGKKLQEESLELILSALEHKRDKVVYEAADLMFFYMVFLVFADIDFFSIIDELKRREGISGLDEKNSR